LDEYQCQGFNALILIIETNSWHHPLNFRILLPTGQIENAKLIKIRPTRHMEINPKPITTIRVRKSETKAKEAHDNSKKTPIRISIQPTEATSI
jgi:hypothetical protein